MQSIAGVTTDPAIQRLLMPFALKVPFERRLEMEVVNRHNIYLNSALSI